jgi:hypothetical protein
MLHEGRGVGLLASPDEIVHDALEKPRNLMLTEASEKGGINVLALTESVPASETPGAEFTRCTC